MANLSNLIVNGCSRFLNKIFAKDIEASGDVKASTFTGDLKGNADSASSVAWSNVTGKPSTYSPSTHNHSNVLDSGNSTATTLAYSKAGLTDASWLAAWNGYELRAISPTTVRSVIDASPTGHSHSWSSITSKPSTFAPASHKQAYTSAECTSYTGDDNTLGVTPAAVKKAFDLFSATPKSHTHTKSQISDFPTSLPANGGTSSYTNYINANNIESKTDLNNLKTPGFYYCAANATVATFINSPTTNALFMIIGKHAGIYQEVIEYTTSSPKRWMRNYYNGTWGSWKQIYTSANPQTSVTGSSGSCTGNAATASKLGTATKGSSTQPIYLDGGTPTACTYTLGKSVPSNAVFTDTNTWIAFKGATTSAAGTAGYAPAPTAGSANRYLRSDGTWAVPPDTNTNTTNTAGSTNTSSKIFLIGATSQASAPVTYSHDTAYVGTDGCLYSASTKVSTVGHSHCVSQATEPTGQANGDFWFIKE